MLEQVVAAYSKVGAGSSPSAGVKGPKLLDIIYNLPPLLASRS